MMDTAGLYIHVPFCVRKCPYCDFYSVLAQDERIAVYTAAVCRNLREYASLTPIDSIYFGGGTPSLLLPEQVAEILAAVADAFPVSDDTEVTLEANPATLDTADLGKLRKAGINRLSIGVQSLDDACLQQLGRLHTAQQAIQTVKDAAAAGFSNVSCDLMLATLGQTSQVLKKTIRQLAELPIQHVSAYLLKVEPGTPFAAAHVETNCPDSDTAAELYLQAVEQLATAGFLQYEISNFAKPGFESRHNCKYWRCVPYLGIGPSAHSCWNGRRFFVPSSLAAFLDTPVQPTELEDDDPCTREEQIMLGLRLAEGVPACWLSGKAQQIARLIQAGYLRRQGERIAMTSRGFLVSNAILAELL